MYVGVRNDNATASRNAQQLLMRARLLQNLLLVATEVGASENASKMGSHVCFWEQLDNIHTVCPLPLAEVTLFPTPVIKMYTYGIVLINVVSG